MTGTHPDESLHSPFVVISWWSNCLALTCLYYLRLLTTGRTIYVVQVGKSEEQKERFRSYLPPGVIELPYPAGAPAEHSRVVYHTAMDQLKEQRGLWFIDHDLILFGSSEPWFGAADVWLSHRDICLCLPASTSRMAITNPAFWISPQRWPDTITNFDPVPFAPNESVQRPDLYTGELELQLPEMDTLVQARDELERQGCVGYYPLHRNAAPGLALTPFPAHKHLGGLTLFMHQTHPAGFDEWTRATVLRFRQFFDTCPPEWLAVEDPELLRRVAAFEIGEPDTERDPVDFASYRPEKLPVSVNRRQLLSALNVELGVLEGTSQGYSAHKISDLGQLPDDILGGMVIGIAEDCQVETPGDYVEARPRGAMEVQRLFPVDSPAAAVLESFDGQAPLQQIADNLTSRFGWPAERSFAYTRGVFFYLAQCGVCVPIR